MQVLGRYVIDLKDNCPDFDRFISACRELSTLNSENLKDNIDIINNYLQNTLRNPDYKEDLKYAETYDKCMILINIAPCLARLDIVVDEINYAITSVSKYNTKIDPSKKLTHPYAEKISKIIQIYLAESLVYPDKILYGHQTEENFYSILHSSYFTEEGATGIESLLV